MTCNQQNQTPLYLSAYYGVFAFYKQFAIIKDLLKKLQHLAEDELEKLLIRNDDQNQSILKLAVSRGKTLALPLWRLMIDSNYERFLQY